MRLVIAFLIGCAATVAQMPDVKGDWVLTIVRFGEPDYTRLKLESNNGHYTGKIWGGVQLDGVAKGSSLEFQCSYEDEYKQRKACGSLSVSASQDEMKGQGKIFDEPATISAKRDVPPNGRPRTHQFTPTRFHRLFSGNIEPALQINPHDTVETKSVDAGGVDEKGEHCSMGGNPLTGPFYIEGAVPGDTLVVHLNRVRLNRDTAGIYNDTVVGSTVDPTISAI
jgi:amidase